MSDDTNPNLSTDTSENQEPTPDGESVKLAKGYTGKVTELPVPCPPTPTPDKPKA